ncbi:acyltransferase family protein [Devosia sp.]|uniref:acyltransferase family protein n=1 Tax=Devosia sp. TaxID=1871048 RepID=UPI003BAD16BF
MTDNRLAGADFVRAAACTTVLLHHLMQRLNADGPLDPILRGLKVFSHIGTFGVAMFFVLSGFLLARPFWEALDEGRPLPSLRVYALRRVARIVPGFWLAMTVTFLLSVTVFAVPFDGQLLLRFASGMLLVADWHWVTLFPVEINGPLWSISFEATSYVLMPLGFMLLFALTCVTGRGWGARLGWVAVLALTLAAHLAFKAWFPMDELRRGWDFGLMGGAKSWMPNYNPFSLFAMFAVGSLAAGLEVRWRGLSSWVFDLLSLAGIVLALFVLAEQMKVEEDSGYGLLGIPYAYPWMVLSVGVVLAATPHAVLLGRVLDNPVTRYVAKISFGIYIWHYVVIELVRQLWMPGFTYGNMGASGFVPTALGVTAVSVVLGHLSFVLVERPAVAWARKREIPAVAGRAPTANLS